MTRKLLYIPIIHMSQDLGSVASDLDRRGEKLCGEERWKKHKETIDGFWKVVSDYLESVNPANLKIYQDGLVADAEMGMKIVQESVRKGSKNYEIIAKLLEKGATLVKTEDISTVKKEYDSIMKITKSRSSIGRFIAALQYKFKKKKLLKERDEYIVKTIDKTLMEGDSGILFVGAYHDVLSKLPKDIVVEEVKDRAKIGKYQEILPYRRKKERFDELAEYITSPVRLKEG